MLKKEKDLFLVQLDLSSGTSGTGPLSFIAISLRRSTFLFACFQDEGCDISLFYFRVKTTRREVVFFLMFKSGMRCTTVYVSWTRSN